MQQYCNTFKMGLVVLLLAAGLMISCQALAENADIRYEITSPVSGVIKQVYVHEGKNVKQGELLLEFDDTLLLSDLAEARAQLKLAKDNLTEAKKELARARELYDRTVLSEHELQQAKISYSKAAASSAAADNHLAHAQWNLTHSKLHAPFDGLVTRLSSYPGQYVNNAFTAQTLMLMQLKK